MKIIRNLLIMVLVLVFVVVGASVAVVAYATVSRPVQYAAQIQEAAQENGLDPLLIYAVIDIESDFDPQAESHMNAKGLMQILPETGQSISDQQGLEFDEADLMDPGKNIALGSRYLKYLLNHFEDRDLAIAAYNGGMGNVESWLKDDRYSKDGRTLHKIPFSETDHYVNKIHASYNIYKIFYEGKDMATIENMGVLRRTFTNYFQTIRYFVKGF